MCGALPSYPLHQCFPNFFACGPPFFFGTTTADLHLLAHVNIIYPDERYPKFKMYVSEMTQIAMNTYQ